MTPVDILKSARALVAQPERWCQGHGGRYGDAVCCLVALNDASKGDHVGDKYDHAKSYFTAAIQRRYVAQWNDDPWRTHAEVLSAFDRAIALAEKEAQS